MGSGLVVYRLDLAWPDEHVAAEYDGRQHAKSLSADASRRNALLEDGWCLLGYAAEDVGGRAMDATAQQVLRALEEGRRRPRATGPRRFSWATRGPGASAVDLSALR